MKELDDVIKALECCITTEEDMCRKDTCPYYDSFNGCALRLRKDALEILKKMQPVEPVVRHGFLFCGECGVGIVGKAGWEDVMLRYCTNCGKGVKQYETEHAAAE